MRWILSIIAAVALALPACGGGGGGGVESTADTSVVIRVRADSVTPAVAVQVYYWPDGMFSQVVVLDWTVIDPIAAGEERLIVVGGPPRDDYFVQVTMENIGDTQAAIELRDGVPAIVEVWADLFSAHAQAMEP